MVQLDEDPFEENEFIVHEDEVAGFRETLLRDIAEEPNLYHPKDVETIRTNYEICRRYIRHKRKDMDAAIIMAKKSLRWRCEFGVNELAIEECLSELSEKNIYRLYMNVGCFIPFKKDKMGSQCIIFRTKLHRKSADRAEDMKRYLAFWIERFLYEEKQTRITFIFDSTAASYSSMDFDQITFTIRLFNELYPWALGYVIVYNMPWMLKTMWGGIQALIPSEGTDRFKVCSGDEIFEFIDKDNLPTFMGGNVPVPFRELTNEEIDSVPVDPDIEKKIFSTPEIISFYRDNFGLFQEVDENSNKSRKLAVFSCSPESLVFTMDGGVQKSGFSLTNSSSDGRSIAFKLKTNCVEGYTVRPFIGVLDAGESVQICVTKDMRYPVNIVDKLLVQAVPVDKKLSHSELTSFWKSQDRKEIFEKKLRCSANSEEVIQDSGALSMTSTISGAAPDRTERMLKRLTADNERQRIINWMMFALLIVNFAVLFQMRACSSSSEGWFC